MSRYLRSKISGIIMAAVILAAGFAVPVLAQTTVTIDFNDTAGTFNPAMVGSSVLPYYKAYDYKNRQWVHRPHHLAGGGVWDPNTNKLVPEMVDLAKAAGLNYIRFSSMNNYEWKNAVDILANRPAIYGASGTDKILFGPMESVQFSESISATPVFIIPLDIYTARDAADFVEYLNDPVGGTNPNGGTDWASKRQAQGHANPVNAVWFEYGNEPYILEDGPLPLPTPATYAANYLAYRSAMQAVDPNIKLGAALINDANHDWTKQVIAGVKGNVDFFVIHPYIPNFYKSSEPTSANNLMQIGLAGLNEQQADTFQGLNKLIKDITGLSNIPILATEFNGLFIQNLPVPYRHTLGNALINAEHVHRLMKMDNLLTGMFWQFSNSYWGMVDGATSPAKRRPQYYPFQYYRDHFNTVRLNPQVNTTTYEINTSAYGVDPAYGTTQLEDIRYDNLLVDSANLVTNPGFENDLAGWYDSSSGATATGSTTIVDATVSQLGNKSVQVIFDGTRPTNYYHVTQYSVPVTPNTTYQISGFVKTDDIDTAGEGVMLAVQNGLNSVLATTDRLTGTHPWTLLSATFTTPATTSKVNVYLRRRGGGETIQGSAWWDDIQLAKPKRWNLNSTATGAKMTQQDGVLTVTFDGTTDINLWQPRMFSIPVESGAWYRLSGWIKTRNLTGNGTNEGVFLEIQDGVSISGTPHLKGTNDWTYVETDYRMAAATATIYTRRLSGGGAISGTAQFRDVHLQKLRPKHYGKVPHIAVNASKSADGKRTSLMVVNKDMLSAIPATINITAQSPIPAKWVEAWTLNGPLADATNETVANNVTSSLMSVGQITNNSLSFTFPAHSLTALTLREIDPSLVAFYHMENNEGRVIGSTPDSNSGAINGGATLVNGRSGNALQFDGVNDYVNFGSDASLNAVEALTVTAWIYPTAAPAGQGRTVASRYAYFSDAPDTGWNLGPTWGNSSKFQFAVYGSSGSASAADPSFFTRRLNQWSHVTGVFQGGHFVKVYVDGVLVQTDTTSVPTTINYGKNAELTVGRRSTQAQSYFQGVIDEVKVYKRALSDSEVWVEYQQP